MHIIVYAVLKSYDFRVCFSKFNKSGAVYSVTPGEQVLTPEKKPESVAEKKPVVVTRSFCVSVVSAIQKKEIPYWNPQTEKCNEESRTELISQCDVLVRGFGDKLGELCPKDEPCKGECGQDVMKPGQ